MIDHAGADKGVARAIEIHSPRIARAVREDLELFCARMIAGHCGIDFDRRKIRISGIFHHRIREHAMSHVKPAVRSPGEAVEQFMPILQAKAALQHGAPVSLAIPVCVFQE